MANKKIDSVKLSGGTDTYYFDLPSDATPSISSLTTGTLTVSGTSNLTDVYINGTKFDPSTIAAKSYTISTTLTGVSVSGGSKIAENSSVGLVISPTTGYTLSSDLSKFNITGASFLSWMNTYSGSTSKTLLIGNPTANVSLVLKGVPNTYNITYSLSNITASTKPTTIEYDGGAAIKLAANTGYNLPSSITVTNAAKSYTQSTGIITLSKCTGAVTIKASGVLKTYTITKTISHGSASGASSISHGGSATVTITPNSGYLVPTSVTVSGATYSYNSTTGVVSLSNATGNVTIKATCPEKPKVVVVGNLINMTLGNSTPAAGTNNLYRVLKIDGNIVEVVAMYDISTSQKFNPSGSGQTYSGSSLDTYLNNTFYNTLNSTAKAAIVDNTITQYKYPYSSSSYTDSHKSYADYSSKAVYTSGLTRHIYALDVEDIEMYFGGTGGSASANTKGTFTSAQLWQMFWNTTSQPSNYTYPWLRSASSSYSDSCWYVGGYGGYVRDYGYYTSYAARPAFKIDLSKIEWSLSE